MFRRRRSDDISIMLLLIRVHKRVRVTNGITWRAHWRWSARALQFAKTIAASYAAAIRRYHRKITITKSPRYSPYVTRRCNVWLERGRVRVRTVASTFLISALTFPFIRRIRNVSLLNFRVLRYPPPINVRYPQLRRAVLLMNNKLRVETNCSRWQNLVILAHAYCTARLATETHCPKLQPSG